MTRGWKTPRGGGSEQDAEFDEAFSYENIAQSKSPAADRYGRTQTYTSYRPSRDDPGDREYRQDITLISPVAPQSASESMIGDDIAFFRIASDLMDLHTLKNKTAQQALDSILTTRQQQAFHDRLSTHMSNLPMFPESGESRDMQTVRSVWGVFGKALSDLETRFDATSNGRRSMTGVPLEASRRTMQSTPDHSTPEDPNTDEPYAYEGAFQRDDTRIVSHANPDPPYYSATAAVLDMEDSLSPRPIGPHRPLRVNVDWNMVLTEENILAKDKRRGNLFVPTQLEVAVSMDPDVPGHDSIALGSAAVTPSPMRTMVDHVEDQPIVTRSTIDAVPRSDGKDTVFRSGDVTALTDLESRGLKETTRHQRREVYTTETARNRKVEVLAPESLPAGFQFEAKVDDKVFLATVPQGGVEKGQVFVSKMRDVYGEENSRNREFLNMNVPKFRWRTSSCDCFHHGFGHPFVWTALFCPHVALSQIMARLRLSGTGENNVSLRSRTRLSSINCLSFAVVFLHAFYGLYFLIVSPTMLSVGIATLALVALDVFLLLYFFCMVRRTRHVIRREYAIKDIIFGDACMAICCTCCTLTQMGYHTADFDTYRAHCCTDTGLARHVEVKLPLDDVNRRRVASGVAV